MIINVFWKYFLGKIYRVDFESIIDIETGLINQEYHTATIYKDEKCEWSEEIIKSVNQTGNFVLYHTNFDRTNECWTMYKNTNPIPRAMTTRNIHQLQHENNVLKDRIAELEKKNI